MKYFVTAILLLICYVSQAQNYKTYCTESGNGYSGIQLSESAYEVVLMDKDSSVITIKKINITDCKTAGVDFKRKKNSDLVKGVILLSASTAAMIAGTALTGIGIKNNNSAMRFTGLSLTSVSIVLNVGTIINLAHTAKGTKTNWNF
jgi:hypothetical protein